MGNFDCLVVPALTDLTKQDGRSLFNLRHRTILGLMPAGDSISEELTLLAFQPITFEALGFFVHDQDANLYRLFLLVLL